MERLTEWNSLFWQRVNETRWGTKWLFSDICGFTITYIHPILFTTVLLYLQWTNKTYSRGKQNEHTPFWRGLTPSLYRELTQTMYRVSPHQCMGSHPVNVPQLTRVVKVHCTRNYPQADQSAARNLETTNHKSACGVVAVTMHLD